ncbi:sensor histidine kinase [Nonomuraea phyllanthi]|uniref:histidine kinase n=1 Tax=Nonomuraea phyllanthi TaxID=2219224 RepID=A0A5C4VHF9_9ACTN|nr:histidine kinase [Nonomuraea phyllanthi]KAB8189076.1 sensor histidine kinase [Nonomuraea phyllanthi]
MATFVGAKADAIRAAVCRHERGVDALWAALVAVVDGLAAGVVAGWPQFVVLHALLVWRRRAPVTVFWAALASAVLIWAVAAPGVVYPVVVVLVALYTLARHRPWHHLWPAAVGVEGVWVTALAVNGVTWEEFAALTAFLAAGGLLGVTVRLRQAHVTQLRERARQLERERDQQVRMAASAERVRIAREMHDVVAHNLAVMVALADGGALAAPASPQRAAEALSAIAATGRRSLGEMHRLLGVLRDGEVTAELSPQPDLDQLDTLVEQVRAAGLPLTLTREGDPPELGEGAGLTIYRIVQEGLTNILKHAGPRATARVRLRFASGGADIEITDDGGGRRAAPALPGRGHGLSGMAERAAAYHGQVDFRPLAEAGWRVHVRLRLT